MIKLKLVAASAILSAGIANPAFAQAIIQESGAYAKNYATADLAIGAPRPSRSVKRHWPDLHWAGAVHPYAIAEWVP
jgi:hypothetical protein